VARAHERFVVLDLHSYNHRRGGPSASPDDPSANPDVNLGTGSLDRDLWAPVADAFLDAMARERVGGRALDVRENVRFKGGWFSRWVNETYAGRGCALAIEMKKIFMDEWTGAPDSKLVAEIGDALGRVASAVRAALDSSPRRVGGAPPHPQPAGAR
jgi:N-formylglutamate deformylase